MRRRIKTDQNLFNGKDNKMGALGLTVWQGTLRLDGDCSWDGSRSCFWWGMLFSASDCLRSLICYSKTHQLILGMTCKFGGLT